MSDSLTVCSLDIYIDPHPDPSHDRLSVLRSSHLHASADLSVTQTPATWQHHTNHSCLCPLLYLVQLTKPVTLQTAAHRNSLTLTCVTHSLTDHPSHGAGKNGCN